MRGIKGMCGRMCAVGGKAIRIRISITTNMTMTVMRVGVIVRVVVPKSGVAVVNDRWIVGRPRAQRQSTANQGQAARHPKRHRQINQTTDPAHHGIGDEPSTVR